MTPPKEANPPYPPPNPPTKVYYGITGHRDHLWVVDWCTSWTPYGLHGIIHRQAPCLNDPCTTHRGEGYAATHRAIPRNNSERNPVPGDYFVVRFPGKICYDCRLKDRTQHYLDIYKGQLNDSRWNSIPYQLADLTAELGSAEWWAQAEAQAKERAERMLHEQGRGPDLFRR